MIECEEVLESGEDMENDREDSSSGRYEDSGPEGDDVHNDEVNNTVVFMNDFDDSEGGNASDDSEHDNTVVFMDNSNDSDASYASAYA